jgi:hypothetical protein
MKVKDLIKELKKYNLNSNIEINLTDGTCLPIQKIEQDQMEEFSNQYLYLITENKQTQDCIVNETVPYNDIREANNDR